MHDSFVKKMVGTMTTAQNLCHLFVRRKATTTLILRNQNLPNRHVEMAGKKSWTSVFTTAMILMKRPIIGLKPN